MIEYTVLNCSNPKKCQQGRTITRSPLYKMIDASITGIWTIPYFEIWDVFINFVAKL